MQVRSGYPARAAHQTDHLTLLDQVSHFDFEFRLVQVGRINAPAVIDDRSVAAHGQRSGEDHAPGCRSQDLSPDTAAKIQPGVEVSVGAAIV